MSKCSSDVPNFIEIGQPVWELWWNKQTNWRKNRRVKNLKPKIHFFNNFTKIAETKQWITVLLTCYCLEMWTQRPRRQTYFISTFQERKNEINKMRGYFKVRLFGSTDHGYNLTWSVKCLLTWEDFSSSLGISNPEPRCLELQYWVAHKINSCLAFDTLTGCEKKNLILYLFV